MKHPLLLFFFLCCIPLSFGQLPDKAEDISPLLIGEKLPVAIIYDASNQAHKVNDVIKAPTVIIFYRGSWCPYCNAHLATIAQIEKKINELGYQIIAISPDDIPNLDDVAVKNNVKYRLYADKNGELIQGMGIAFTPSEKTKLVITKKTKGTATDILPVPSVFIVDGDGVILMEYINPNYKKRISGELLLSILKGLKES